MVDSIETYEATLSEVRRQAAQLSNLSSSGGEEAGGAAAAGRRSGSGSGSIASETSSDWVVLESSTAPPALPTEAAGCSVWPQQQWQIAYEILVSQHTSHGSRSSLLPSCRACCVKEGSFHAALSALRSSASAQRQSPACAPTRQMTCSSLSALMRQQRPPAPASLCGAAAGSSWRFLQTCSGLRKAWQAQKAQPAAALAAAPEAAAAAARRRRWTGGPLFC